ncbi:hypothetical protein [Dactylosporangium sp. CA-233914]|uniref:hypothetical protein n=1 Tax=Dactylosporangium sp. CA-233914 TaxID=3239934 RepID=UPI003D8C255F
MRRSMRAERPAWGDRLGRAEVRAAARLLRGDLAPAAYRAAMARIAQLDADAGTASSDKD